MAETTNSPENPANSNSPQPIPQSDPPDLPPPSTSSATTPPNPNPILTTPTQPSFLSHPPPPQQLHSFPSYAPPPLQIASTAVPFRPGAPPIPLPAPTQFSPIPNIGFQQQSQRVQVQPPGVGPGSVTVSYGQPPPMRPYGAMTNGYLTMTQGIMQPPGIPRYPSIYPGMIRPTFPQRPPGIVGMVPALVRHPIPGIRGPIIPPVVRPAGIPSVIPAEKPQTTVYVGKISTTIDNEFMISVLQLCGPVKSWKRAQDPTSGLFKGFGICEFDSAEGVLRAIRLLSKLNVDGQEFMLNFSQATKEYLARYVEKKRENSKSSEATGPVGAVKDEEGAPGVENYVPAKSSEGDSKVDVEDMSNKDSQDIAKFGLVTEEDQQADREALEKLTVMLEERQKANPLPPPPPPPPLPTTMATEGSGTLHSEVPTRSREVDSDTDVIDKDTAEARNDDEMTSEIQVSSEHDKAEADSPSRSRKTGRGRNRDRDAKQEKERELEKYEREREQERVKREKDREYRIREDERRYRIRVKDWESREREKEHMRKLEREREKEREQERKWEVMDQENESDDGYSKKRKHKSSAEERKRRQREKDEDLADRLKEMEEIAEAKKRAEEEQEKRKLEEEHFKRKLEEEHVKRKLEEENTKFLSAAAAATVNRSEEASLSVEVIAGNKDKVIYQPPDGDSEHDNHMIDMFSQNGTGDESGLASVSTPDMHQSSNAQTRKLGFGLVGSGKRAAVPSVFHEEEDEDAKKDKKMRPLVPIDYTTEELQAVQNNLSGAPSPNLAAAAEFAKCISSVNSKEERPEAEKDRSKRSHDRSSLRDRERTDHETNRIRDASRKEKTERDKERERGSDKTQTPENKKLLDAKQLIDTIPKTKDELFSYEINWAVYDKNELHERMRPWISKKITDFLGEEETTLVDYIVSTTKEHVDASEVLQRLQSILDDEAEMFVLKMWRMLIFEIKKVETGLALRSKS